MRDCAIQSPFLSKILIFLTKVGIILRVFPQQQQNIGLLPFNQGMQEIGKMITRIRGISIFCEQLS